MISDYDRFMLKVEKIPFVDCWLWVGAYKSTADDSGAGYGSFSVNGKSVPAHRWMYEFINGPLPAGYEPDHLCRVHACVRPDHLEGVTGRVNTLRGVGPTAINAKKTHCCKGHRFTTENTYFSPTGSRVCRACKRIEWGLRQVAKGARTSIGSGNRELAGTFARSPHPDSLYHSVLTTGASSCGVRTLCADEIEAGHLSVDQVCKRPACFDALAVLTGGVR